MLVGLVYASSHPQNADLGAISESNLKKKRGKRGGKKKAALVARKEAMPLPEPVVRTSDYFMCFDSVLEKGAREGRRRR